MNQNPMIDFTPITQQCKTHGEYMSYKMGDHWTGCEQCIEQMMLEKQNQENDTFAKEVHNDKVKALSIDAGLKPLHENYVIIDKIEHRIAMSSISQNQNLIIHGDYGTGKTYLGICVIKESIKKYKKCFYANTKEMCADILEDIYKSRKKAHQYGRADLLVLDEVGELSKKESEVLFWVLDERYQQMKPTVFITNHTIAEFNLIIGERLMDRIEDGVGCKVIHLKGQSFRRSKGKS
jgi:DNA replication protein DnaC